MNTLQQNLHLLSSVSGCWGGQARGKEIVDKPIYSFVQPRKNFAFVVCSFVSSCTRTQTCKSINTQYAHKHKTLPQIWFIHICCANVAMHRMEKDHSGGKTKMGLLNSEHLNCHNQYYPVKKKASVGIGW